MKMQYYFFMFIFLSLTQFVNAQGGFGDPNRYSQVWIQNDFLMVGIENMDDDPDKEIVGVLKRSFHGLPDQVAILNAFDGHIEYVKNFYEIKISESSQNLSDVVKLIDVNNDGIYEVLINAALDTPLSGSTALYNWRLYAFGGVVKHVKPVVK